jgi:hypothetical protein
MFSTSFGLEFRLLFELARLILMASFRDIGSVQHARIPERNLVVGNDLDVEPKLDCLPILSHSPQIPGCLFRQSGERVLEPIPKQEVSHTSKLFCYIDAITEGSRASNVCH